MNSKLNIPHSPFALPRYDRYKDSGIEWLGEVPEHWEVQSLRSVAGLYVEKNQPDLPVLSVYREYGVILKDSRDDNHNATSLDTSNYKVVRPGDLAVNKMKAWQGSLGVSEHHGIVSPAYITCRLNQEKVTGRYIHYLLRSKSLIGALDSISYGVRVGQWDMRFEDFKKVGITIPPKPEQDRIVAFLDQKTAEIDALIAKKQRQIELLDEQKAILINRAVTRGIVNSEFGMRNEHLSSSSHSTFTTHNSKFSPSGIEWIGDIPEHWEVKKLKYLINIQAGYAFKSSAYSHKDTDIRLLRGVNVNPGQINWNDAVYWPHDKLRDVSDFMLDSDDMVMGMDRPWVGAGVRIARITKTDLPALLLQRVARIRATGIEPDYLERTLTGSGFKAYFEPILTGVSVPHISPDQIACYVAAVPPKVEQTKICEFIKEADSLVAKTARAAEAQIESLRALRSTLIAHAVTGRIKV